MKKVIGLEKSINVLTTKRGINLDGNSKSISRLSLDGSLDIDLLPSLKVTFFLILIILIGTSLFFNPDIVNF